MRRYTPLAIDFLPLLFRGQTEGLTPRSLFLITMDFFKQLKSMEALMDSSTYIGFAIGIPIGLVLRFIMCHGVWANFFNPWYPWNLV
jgi:hypothetical protein